MFPMFVRMIMGNRMFVLFPAGTAAFLNCFFHGKIPPLFFNMFKSLIDHCAYMGVCERIQNAFSLPFIFYQAALF